MKVLEDISSELVVALDIETARKYNHLDEAPQDMQDAWAYKYRNKEDITRSELEDLWYEEASLEAEFSKVISVSIVFLFEGKLVCKNFSSTNEGDLLSALGETLDKMYRKNRKYRLLTHGGLQFDYPFLSKRYVVNSLEIPKALDSSGLKPWLISNLDTVELWKLGGVGKATSLVALCAALEVPTSKGDMTGAEVGDAYYRGELDAIGAYCDKDTVATFNVFRRFKRETIFQFDQVAYYKANTKPTTPSQTVASQSVPVDNNAEAPKPVTNTSEEAPMDSGEVTPVEILAGIFHSKEFSEEDKEAIRGVFGTKKPTKKHIEFLKTVLEGCYVEHAMFKSDKKDVVTQKKKEVEEFIDSLTKKK